MFNADTDIIESEVAEEAEGGNMFDFFDKFEISSNQIIELVARGCVMFSQTRKVNIKSIISIYYAECPTVLRKLISLQTRNVVLLSNRRLYKVTDVVQTLNRP